MTTLDVQKHLQALGFKLTADGAYGPRTFQKVKDFQAGFAFYDLLIDGQAGPQVWAALTKAVSSGGKCSEHFKFIEFKCKCNKPAPFCGGDIWVKRELIRGLEIYRQRYGPTTPISGCRCVSHNRAVGGATNSQHLYGGACDLSPVASMNSVRNLRVFCGIGYVAATGKVAHADVRGQGGTPNTTGGSVAVPTLWKYR